MGHNVPELPRSALVPIRNAVDLALVQIVLDVDGQRLLCNCWEGEQMNLFSGSPLSDPLLQAESDSFDIAKIQYGRSEKLIANLPLTLLAIRQMKKAVRSRYVSNANVGDIAEPSYPGMRGKRVVKRECRIR